MTGLRGRVERLEKRSEEAVDATDFVRRLARAKLRVLTMGVIPGDRSPLLKLLPGLEADRGQPDAVFVERVREEIAAGRFDTLRSGPVGTIGLDFGERMHQRRLFAQNNANIANIARK